MSSPSRRKESKNSHNHVFHTLVVSGELDMLLRLQETLREPEAMSTRFLYKWVATSGMKKDIIKKEKSKSLVNLCAHAIAQNWNAYPEEKKTQLADRIPIDLWKRIFYFIPITNDKVLQIGRFFERLGRCNLMETSMWKLQERSVMLFEFIANEELSVLALRRYSKFFPDLHFILRTSKRTSSASASLPASPLLSRGDNVKTNTNGGSVEEPPEKTNPLANPEHNQFRAETITTIYEGRIGVERRFTVRDNLTQNRSNWAASNNYKLELKADDPSELHEFQDLFRDCSKMAFQSNGSSPDHYYWVPLYSNSLDMLYVWQQQQQQIQFHHSTPSFYAPSNPGFTTSISS